MANISKIKRDELLSKINDIKDYISSCVRNERTEELIKYLNDIKLYFTDDEFAKFIKYYGIEKLDDERLKYNEWLSAFLNV